MAFRLSSRTRARGRKAARRRLPWPRLRAALSGLTLGLATLALFVAVAGPAAAIVPQDSGTAWYLNNVKFATDDIGWAVGAAGTILKTNDGGAHWSDQTSGTGYDLTDIDAISSTTAWAVGDGGVVLTTTDGGANWQSRSSGYDGFLLGVDFVDANTGWAVGDEGKILKSTNGGVNWTPQSSGKTDVLLSVSFRDADHGVVVGDMWGSTTGTILRTANGGTTWTAVTTPAAVTLYDVQYADSTHAWAVGDAGTILKSADDGATWTQKYSDNGFALDGVSFSSVSTGWAVGSPDAASPYHGALLGTTDGGETWVKRDSGTSNYLYGVDFVSATRGYVSGDSGTIIQLDMRPPSGSMSIDGGTAWTLSTSATIDSSVERAESMRFRLAGGTWGSWLPYASSTPFTLEGAEGQITVEGQYVSAEGVVLETSDQIGYDLSAPVTTDDAPAFWAKVYVLVTFTASDAGSGLQYTKYKVDSGEWQTGGSVVVDAPADHSNDGIHTITYYSVDNLGNTEDPKTCNVRIDTTVNSGMPSDTEVVLSGGPLSVDSFAVSDFTTVQMSGVAQQTTAMLDPFTVTDSRGTGAGWRLTVQASRFWEWDGGAFVPDGHSLPIGSLHFPGLAAEAVGTVSGMPAVSSYDGYVDGTGTLVLASSATGEGMGTYQFSATDAMSLSIPSAAYAGTYRAVLTMSVISGP